MIQSFYMHIVIRTHLLTLKQRGRKQKRGQKNSDSKRDRLQNARNSQQVQLLQRLLLTDGRLKRLTKQYCHWVLESDQRQVRQSRKAQYVFSGTPRSHKEIFVFVYHSDNDILLNENQIVSDLARHFQSGIIPKCSSRKAHSAFGLT